MFKNFGKLEIIVFVCGTVVMILELIGSRILAPYLGTSIFVWTSLIGIILGALSLGYYLGGQVSKQNPNYKILATVIFLAGIFIFLIALFKAPVLNQAMKFGVKLGSVIATIILFALPSILLGMVSPYAIRLKIKNIETSGKVAGNLYALSTIGSILGTFSAGFYLIPNFSNTNILFGLSLVLVLTSLLSHSAAKKILRVLIILIIIFNFLISPYLRDLSPYLVDVDSAYNHIRVIDVVNSKNNLKERLLFLSTEIHAVIYLNSAELAAEYTKLYRLDNLFKPDIKRGLLLGGGGYVVALDFLKRYPQGKIDVSEIDPKVTEIAYQFFNLKDDPRLNIYHQDARIFLNQTEEKYDIIYGDAFGSYFAVPFQLTTLEAVQKIYDLLDEKGIAMINIISALEGEKSLFLQAEYKTFAQVFPNLYLFPVYFWQGEGNNRTQNIILVATKGKKLDKEKLFKKANEEQKKYLERLWEKDILKDNIKILTDELAPVDFYVSKYL